MFVFSSCDSFVYSRINNFYTTKVPKLAFSDLESMPRSEARSVLRMDVVGCELLGIVHYWCLDSQNHTTSENTVIDMYIHVHTLYSNGSQLSTYLGGCTVTVTVTVTQACRNGPKSLACDQP